MDTKKSEEIKQAIRERYGAIATGTLSSCCGDKPAQTIKQSSCCPPKGPDEHLVQYSTSVGYTQNDVFNVPAESNMALGCGNPTALAKMKEGEVVVDLGSGGGFDCFLAANQVGSSGKVIGVDMTPDMITKARLNAEKSNFGNVEFRLGEIEHLPIADSTADVIISNCVINLSTDKPQVFREAFRVLKPGGRLAVSDVVLTAQLPPEILGDMTLYCECTSGAIFMDEYRSELEKAGFINISINPKEDSHTFIREWHEGVKLENYIMSANIEAEKPKE